MRYRFDEVEAPETLEPGTEYTPRQLEAYADKLLREDSRSELCRQCQEPGEATGAVKPTPQDAQDAEGNALTLDFPEYECEAGHRWYAGEGTVRGIGGESPILFREHFDSRKRREIYTSCGTPDPEIVSGIYNRSHPQGRKINSSEQRRKNGASYYR